MTKKNDRRDSPAPVMYFNGLILTMEGDTPEYVEATTGFPEDWSPTARRRSPPRAKQVTGEP
jgi:hypothetical protein